jgi:hypothetical protein
MLPVSWYCCQIHSASSAPLVMSSALYDGLDAMAQEAFCASVPPL